MNSLDELTLTWFRHNPNGETAFCQCDTCGRYFKPSLGHECVILESYDTPTEIKISHEDNK